MGSRAEHSLDINPAPHTQIPPHPVNRSVDTEPISDTQRVTSTIGACRDYEGLACFDHQTTICFQSCRLERVADQSIRQIMRAPIYGTRSGHAETGEADATAVLDGRRPSDVEDTQRGSCVAQRRTCLKRTVVPGVKSAGLLRPTFQISAVVRPSRCQPPGDREG